MLRTGRSLEIRVYAATEIVSGHCCVKLVREVAKSISAALGVVGATLLYSCGVRARLVVVSIIARNVHYVVIMFYVAASHSRAQRSVVGNRREC